MTPFKQSLLVASVGALELVPEDGAVRFYLETCMSKTRA